MCRTSFRLASQQSLPQLDFTPVQRPSGVIEFAARIVCHCRVHTEDDEDEPLDFLENATRAASLFSFLRIAMTRGLKYPMPRDLGGQSTAFQRWTYLLRIGIERMEPVNDGLFQANDEVPDVDWLELRYGFGVHFLSEVLVFVFGVFHVRARHFRVFQRHLPLGFLVNLFRRELLVKQKMDIIPPGLP